ncbi:hypothetical protein B4Q13_16200 [Lacticaseibacillus rhamnosus]
MFTRFIPGTQESLPVIGLGSWQTFDVADAARAGPGAVLEAFAQAGGSRDGGAPLPHPAGTGRRAAQGGTWRARRRQL